MFIEYIGYFRREYVVGWIPEKRKTSWLQNLYNNGGKIVSFI